MQLRVREDGFEIQAAYQPNRCHIFSVRHLKMRQLRYRLFYPVDFLR